MTTFFYLKMNGSLHFRNNSPAIRYNLFQTSVMRRNEASVSWVAAKQYFQVLQIKSIFAVVGFIKIGYLLPKLDALQ